MHPDFQVPSNWYKGFFTAAVNHFWETMVPPEATAADVDFIRRHLALEPPASIIDVPCGSGRHALALARRGYRLTGVDLSAEALARGATQALEEGLDVRFIQADMRRLDGVPPAEAILCLGNSLGYFDPASTRLFLAALAGRLRPRGRLLLDSYTCAESIFPLQVERALEFDGGRYEARMAYEPLRSRLKTEALLTLNGETHRLLYAHHIVTAGTLVSWLEEAGFRIVALHGDTDDAPYVPGSSRLLLIAEREP